ncbi:MAG: hypothetical protein K9I99_09905 [Melioribacteraceae bacterium]|nr:hypothetical protein [Melioribacteraceae bacterium]
MFNGISFSFGGNSGSSDKITFLFDNISFLSDGCTEPFNDNSFSLNDAANYSVNLLDRSKVCRALQRWVFLIQ